MFLEIIPIRSLITTPNNPVCDPCVFAGPLGAPHFENSQVLETSPWRVRDSFLQIDLQNAEASVEADALAIKDLVRSSFGFDVVNTMVKEEFMSWLMRAFQEYVKGTIHADDQNVWTI